MRKEPHKTALAGGVKCGPEEKGSAGEQTNRQQTQPCSLARAQFCSVATQVCKGETFSHAHTSTANHKRLASFTSACCVSCHRKVLCNTKEEIEIQNAENNSSAMKPALNGCLTFGRIFQPGAWPTIFIITNQFLWIQLTD